MTIKEDTAMFGILEFQYTFPSMTSSSFSWEKPKWPMPRVLKLPVRHPSELPSPWHKNSKKNKNRNVITWYFSETVVVITWDYCMQSLFLFFFQMVVVCKAFIRFHFFRVVKKGYINDLRPLGNVKPKERNHKLTRK